MRQPKYFVSFGGFNLQNVTNVHDENGRDISEYDSVGAGKFNVPDARKPHTWKIDCQLEEDPPSSANSWRASEIFKAMDSLLENTTDASRLVITNSIYPASNLSVLAWFKNYTKDEKYEGIYDTVVELEEYKPVGVKTTGIPTVARPGKVPVPAKTTISSSNTVYKNYQKTGVGTKADTTSDTSKRYGYYEEQDAKKSYLTDSNTGKPVTNAATVDYGKIYTPKTVSNINPNVPTDAVSAQAQIQGVGDVLKGVGDALNNATGGFLGKWWDAAVNPDTWKW